MDFKNIYEHGHLVTQNCWFMLYHLSSLLCRARFTQSEDIATDRDLSPNAWFGVLVEAIARVHHQHAVCGQSIHLTI